MYTNHISSYNVHASKAPFCISLHQQQSKPNMRDPRCIAIGNGKERYKLKGHCKIEIHLQSSHPI